MKEGFLQVLIIHNSKVFTSSTNHVCRRRSYHQQLWCCRFESGTIREKEEDRAPLTSVTYYWHEMPLNFTSFAQDSPQHHYYILSVDQSNDIAKANFDAALAIIGMCGAIKNQFDVIHL